MQLSTELAPPNDGTSQVCVWQCLDHDDGFARARGRTKPKQPCHKYNILTTKKRDGDRDNQWQNKCRHCGKRTHLNAARVLWFSTRLDATKYVEVVNRDS